MITDETRKNLIPPVSLSCNVLKAAACMIMLIDHIAYGLLHNYLIAHGMDMQPQTYQTLNTVYEVGKGVGRLAFPIFTFFIVEGFMRTRNVKKYALRLFIFAVISELPFDLGLYGKLIRMEHQNIMLTFFIALIMLCVLRYLEQNTPGLSKFVRCLTSVCAVIAFADIAVILKADYSWKCMLLTAVLYYTRSTGAFRLLCGAISTCWEKYAPISFLLLYFYDPEKPPKHKYAFYVFYPLHLIIIYLIGRLII